jgi:hypothetical protein
MAEKRCPGCGSTDVQQVGTNWLCQSCQSTKAMTLDEIVECKAQQAAALAAMLGPQAGRCAACGQASRTPHRDGDRESALCLSCYLLIEDARERHETPELAARWLRAAAQYLTTTERHA